MGDDLTARIDEALAGTTPGPWHWGDRTNLLGIGGDVSPGGYVYSVDVLEIEHDGGCGCRRMCQMDVTLSDEDRTLIAAAPSLLAEARDEIARLRAHVEQLLNACEAADETIDMLKAERTRMTGDMGTDLRMLYSYELGRDTTLAEIAALGGTDGR